MIVDVHRHIVVPEVTREAGGDEPWRPSVRWEEGGQVIELGGQVIRSAVREFVRVDRILEEATSLQMDHVVLSPWVNLLGYALEPREGLHLARLQNEALSAASEANAGRVSAFGTVPLQAPDLAARELEALMRLPGIRGIEVAASVRGEYLGADRLLPLWEAAEATGAVVFVHPTTKGFDLPVFGQYYLWNTVANPVETAVTAAHLVMAGVLERFPGLRVVLAHGGGALLAVRGRLRHAHTFQPQARARLRGSPDESLARLYHDTVTHDTELLHSLITYVGSDHVLLGSDHPFDMGTAHPVEEVRVLDLPPHECDAVLGGNAVRLLDLKEG
ncbi:MAG TPA: amidohydrolase family protein [Actinomycetota bacterium]|nr:amidohydrolase family protein [Actinomycetota bacterium]